MRGDTTRLLAAWERADPAPPAARGAVLVQQAGSLSDALHQPLATCAAAAAQVHVDDFGASTTVVLGCDECGTGLEVDLPLDALAGPAAAPVPVRVDVSSGTVTVRPLTTDDLLAAERAADPVDELVRRSVTSADGDAVGAAELSADDLAAVDAAAERLAGSAATVLSAPCPGCGADVRVGVDLGRLLWEQVRQHVDGLLAEVASLAAAFGWSEGDVLAMSPARRRRYLELVAR